ncbi:MAG: alpha/beta hydrolase [Pseudomonas sp.]|uniref:alpha/beta fold hydrolase n=1 Tax=Pseudomonas sp. TaxID=306 RepID=UPI003BB789E2
MDYQTYGDPDGRPVFYFHGIPGAPTEAAWLAAAAQGNGLRIVALERDSLAPHLQGEAYLAELAAAVVRLAGERPVHLLGFSIGASLALRVAARLPKPAAGIWLVSAAAPLEWPDSWQGMGAGRYTFALAQSYPWLFRLLSIYQGWLARHFAGLLLRSLFQGARGADAQLLAQVPLREQLMDVQRQCFAQGAGAYVRDVQCYVEPWAASLAQVRGAVQLWHGDQDNWAPVRMAQALLAQFGSQAQLHWLAGRSHYSCLLDAAQPLCQQLTAHYCD